ncbi:MAG: type VI secretion system baseplate subunit TssG [Gammaproteobacteria bacterium]|nr:type VI secretion system baseplate subunit TssG [Gammaproteobacteria bacterium]
MAITHRTAIRALELQRQLHTEPFKFDFYWAVRLLECAHPDHPRVGDALRPVDEPLRFSQQASLAFAPSTLAGFEIAKQGEPAVMEILFFGLFGPNGPLPLHLTDYARDRLRNADDSTFTAFANIFHHRLLSLFYRVWANARPAVSYDRPDCDQFAKYTGAVCGYASPALRERDGMPDIAKFHYAGWMSCQTRNADGLRAILSDFFDLPVSIEEFIGHWMTLPVDARLYLGKTRDTGTLGMTAILGGAVWDCQSKFRIRLGPLELIDYERFLPGGTGLKHLRAIVRNYVGDDLRWDLNLILKKQQIPELRLGRERRLGWTSKLVNGELEKDMDDLLLNPLFSLN